MPSVFISYRRDDSAGFAGRLADALEQRLGAGAVFRDVDDIQPGADFEAVIARGLDQVRAVLVVIGPGWLDAAVDGPRRLDRPDDFVRREVEQALASGKPVVPVLVGGATMPAANALPIALRGLASRQALVLGDASWSADLARLEAVLAQWVAPPAASVRSPRRRWLAAVVVAGVAIGGALLWSTRAPGPETIVGQWTAEVAYPWNLTLEEGYDFSVRDGRVEGQASFLGAPRALEDVEWRDGRLRFVTRSQSISGNDPPREMVQRYEVRREGEALRVRLVIERSHSVDAPLEFVAQRRGGSGS
ncbi:MAG: toll/interleukin-1 receptor domain-containing protein [Thauera sp.]|nr:toll/interleukin-1 receptor domain-containing protein [Thauera sp.]